MPPLGELVKAGDASLDRHIQRMGWTLWADLIPVGLKQLYLRERADWAGKTLLLGLAGFNELYAAKLTFGANPWADYTTLFAWGFGAEATRAAVTDLVKNWGITTGE